MKKVSDILSITAMIVIFTFGLLSYKSFKQNSKFENQKIGVSLEKFKSDWGNPDNEFIYGDGNMILSYYSNNFFEDKYIFKFDKTSKYLLLKYYDY